MIELSNLNVIAVVVATIAGMAIGALWYSPVLFGNAWLAALGKTEEELSSPAPAMIGSVVASLVSAICIAIIVAAFGATTIASGALVGALCGIGLVAMAMLSDSLFCGWGWPLYFIQSGYRVVYLVVMGGIVGGWPD
ncbi:MAG: DUF1761 domain-containing protein [Gammaproteobacteria bacterium]